MIAKTIDSLNLVNVINNINSEKIGFYFSFFLHLIILFFAIGFPNFFQNSPIYIPTVIPIEIINVTDTTSISEEKKITQIEETKKINPKPKQFNNIENKKFNNIENQVIKKIEIKDKPEKIIVKEKTITKKINLETDSKNLIKLKENQKVIKTDEQEPKTESLPSEKIKPKIKPKLENTKTTTKLTSDVIVKNKPKPLSSFNIASMLKDLRNDQKSIQKKQNQSTKLKDNKILKEDKNESKEISQLSISEIDLLIQQLAACWSAPAGAKIENWMIITIEANIKEDGRVLQDSVRIIDTNIPKGNPFYKPITESAMRTLLNPECNPLKLPKNKYDQWKNFKINFDLRLMRGYQ